VPAPIEDLLLSIMDKTGIDTASTSTDFIVSRAKKLTL